jgi:hypothetical protein
MVDYVNHQREHHIENTLMNAMEALIP